MKKTAPHPLLIVPALALWTWIYMGLKPAASWLTYGALGIETGTRLGNAVEFFLYDTPKVMMLLLLVVFGVGVLRSFFTPERTRKALAGKSSIAANVLAALLGVATPFCSCSAVPLFIGFVTTGVPLGATFSFLISAPMVNEIALVLLLGLFGWKIALIYLGTGLFIAVASGLVISLLKMEAHVEDWVYEIKGSAGPGEEPDQDWPARFRFGLEAVKDIISKVWPYIIAGIAVGAAIHGYVPENFMASVMGRGAWWSVPFAVLLGIPMYSNAAGIIPVVEALLGKGAAMGTVLAFMMSVIGLSLPEMVILRKVLKPRLIATFIGVVGSGIVTVGYLFNLLI